MFGGRTIPLSLPRRFVGDLVHFAHKVPSIPVQRLMNVAALGRLRSQAEPKPSWVALFTKAYAQVGAEVPELRRAYLCFPWARLYEHYESVASVGIERLYEGEPGVFFAHIHSPEKMSLAELETELRRFKDAPIESIADFQTQLWISSFPKPIRRFLWWYVTHFRGYRKALWMGTYGVSVYSSLGAESLHQLTPLTTALNYGVIQDNGDVMVRITYDHRVMDGATIARALHRLDEVLNNEIANELGTMTTAARVATPSVPAPV